MGAGRRGNTEMKTSTRAAGLAATVVAAVVLGAASFAWACTPQARVSGMSPDSGTPGSKTTLSAENFTPGPVEIRWNGSSGRELATAQGPSFSVNVIIPNVRPGFYTIVAVQRNGTSIVGKASSTFEVIPASATESGGYTYAGGTSEQGPQGAATEGSVNGSQPSRGTSSPTPGNTQGGALPAGSQSYGNAGAAFPSESGTSAAAGEVAVGSQGSRSVGSVAGSRAATAGGMAKEASSGTATDVAATSEVDEPAVRSGSALGDMWSGFEDGSMKSDASLTEPAVGVATPSPLAAGGGILSLGLLAMFAGFGAAEARRRVALANPHR